LNVSIRTRGTCLAVLASLLLGAAWMVVGAGSAAARTIPLYTFTGDYYDGAGSTAGTLAQGLDVGIDVDTGNGYVSDPGRLPGGSVSRFDADGDPVGFPAREGDTAIAMNREGAYRLAVDNSGTASQGNFYVIDGPKIQGFAPSGAALSGFPIGGLRRPTCLAVDTQGGIWGVDTLSNRIVEYGSTGQPTGRSISFEPAWVGFQNTSCDLAIDSADNFYFTAEGPYESFTRKYDLQGNVIEEFAGENTKGVTIDPVSDHLFTLQVSPFANGEFDTEVVEYDESGEQVTAFGAPDPAHSFPGLFGAGGFFTITGISVNPVTHAIYVTNGRDYGGRQHIEIFAPSGEAVVPTVKTILPGLEPTKATLKGTVDPDGGGATTDCHFEWGETALYGNVVPCVPAGPFNAGEQQVTAQLEGLTQGSRYHYRLVSENANGIAAYGRDRVFRPQGPASVTGTFVSDVNTDGARVTAQIDPNGGDTTYRVEYGTEDCDLSTCASFPLPPSALLSHLGTQTASVLLTGLETDRTYHFRLVATNATGDTASPEGTLRTYAVESTADDCANAPVRRQLAAVLLPDCRAYELVSPGNAGGYDVRSDVIPGQVPFSALPRANDRALYSLNFGMVPGVDGEPTNHENDPYVAMRAENGWSTSYVGIPVGGVPYQSSFSSAPLAESDDLSTIAFGGDDICDPCFADGKTGIPLRRGGGPLVQGMAGPLDPGPALADEGYVGRRLSADGSHLVFGSAIPLTADAAPAGDISIYDRDVDSGVTSVVSKTPTGANLPGGEIGSLDISADGSRIAVANLVSTDAAGNSLWHPYLHVEGSAATVDLAPGSTAGVLYGGMTADGSSIFYATVDALTPDDEDTAADVYRATVEGGALTLDLVSDGPGADAVACNPTPGPGSNWNAPGISSPNTCGAVVFAGGSGVARGRAAIYFLSPERLDGSSGVLDEPNLYLAEPNAPVRYVATLEPDAGSIENAVQSNERRSFGDIQVSSTGDFAAFSSDRALTGYPTFGHTAIYLFDAAADALFCASCPTTGAALTAETSLSEYGLNLSDDGRVFFTSDEPLALRDTGSTADVYEWSDGEVSMISTGRSPTDSGLLSVSVDGVNVFFYTREVLVSSDHNGAALKIYTAREGGGFPNTAAIVDCQASDECHGPGSAAPAAGLLPTIQGTGGNYADHPVKKKKKHKKKKHKKKKHKKKNQKRTGGSRGSR
jgi:hypothetical protein